MSDLTERTALAPFNLGDKPIRQGQIVALDRLQLARLAKAGCVTLSDEENAAVPVAGLPATQRADVDFSSDIDEAAMKAAGQIGDIRQTVDVARADADRELAEIRANLDEARSKADLEHAEIRSRLDEARRTVAADEERAREAGERADREIAEHQARVGAATAEAANPDRTVDAAENGGQTPAAAVAAKSGKGRA